MHETSNKIKAKEKRQLTRKMNILFWENLVHEVHIFILISLLIMVVDQLLQICERNFKATQNKTKQKKT